MKNFRCADLHCDLLSYLIEAPGANPLVGGKIGCTFPDLQNGNVNFQVMAIYAATEKGSVDFAFKQALWFKKLLTHYSDYFSYLNTNNVESKELINKITIVTSIENAACICEEDSALSEAFHNMSKLIYICGKPIYLGLTHHGENRFGGGNNTKIGLKDDGIALINWLAEHNIALDFSHMSDNLAYDCLNIIEKNNLHIKVLASHSNFRSVYSHNRNLPDDIAKEIIKRNGRIGINFLRAFLNPDNADAIYDHIAHGLELGGENNICLGADYFYCDSHPDQTRKPFFFPEHENASKYQEILNLIDQKFNENIALKIGINNFVDFLKQNA